MPHKGRKNADQVLLMALACGATTEAAARTANVGLATVYRRQKDPTFCKQLQQLRTDMVQRTAGALTAAGSEAVRTLLDLMKTMSSGATRLGAARSVLEIGMRARELAEVEVRLASLEQMIDMHHPR